MYMSWLVVIGVLAFVIVMGIAYFTRERAGHNVRRDVRDAVVSHEPADPKRGIQS